MTPKKLNYLIVMFLGSLLVSCNLYSPLEGSGSVQDRLEIAQACFTRGDYECALAEYQGLPDGILKDQKLCLAQLSQAGFGLSALVTIFQSNGGNARKALGALANKVLPYTSTKLQAAVDAKTKCATYKTNADAGTDSNEKTLAALVKGMAAMTRCANLMAKTTSALGNGESDTACTTASTHKTVTAASIATATDGSISSGQPGMCNADAVACITDISDLAAAGIGGDTADVQAAVTDLQTAFSVVGAAAARLALITTIP